MKLLSITGEGKSVTLDSKRLNVSNLNRILLFLFFVLSQDSMLGTENISRKPVQSITLPDGLIQITYPPTEEIERAELFFHIPKDVDPRGVLVLVPGRNGNGRKFVDNEGWRQFCRINHLWLCGVSFSSDKNLIDRSYSNAHSGSGELVIRAISNISQKQGKEVPPILMYGFSAGARFTASFVEGNPEKCAAWCGYSVGRWHDAVKNTLMPPGIVASGEWDASCYHASMLYFQQGRKLGKPWLWISLKETEHQRSSDLDSYVKKFFVTMLERPKEERIQGTFYDIVTKKSLTQDQVDEWSIFATWVPSGELEKMWLDLHHP